jgi:hypothetical protein
MHEIGWPDASDFPYRVLIRIRYSHEIDLLALERIQVAVCHVAPPELAREVAAGLTRAAARIASKAAGALEPIRSEQTAERFEKLRESMVSGVLNDWDDDRCGTWPGRWKRWPWPRPPYRKDFLEDLLRIEESRSAASEGGPGTVEREVMPSVELVRVLVSAIEVARGTLCPENLQEVEGLLTKPLEVLAN